MGTSTHTSHRRAMCDELIVERPAVSGHQKVRLGSARFPVTGRARLEYSRLRSAPGRPAACMPSTAVYVEPYAALHVKGYPDNGWRA